MSTCSNWLYRCSGYLDEVERNACVWSVRLDVKYIWEGVQQAGYKLFYKTE